MAAVNPPTMGRTIKVGLNRNDFDRQRKTLSPLHVGGTPGEIVSLSLYKAVFEAENDDIGPENTYFWDVYNE